MASRALRKNHIVLPIQTVKNPRVYPGVKAHGIVGKNMSLLCLFKPRGITCFEEKSQGFPSKDHKKSANSSLPRGCMHRRVFIKKTWLSAFSHAQSRISLVFCLSLGFLVPWSSSLTAESDLADFLCHVWRRRWVDFICLFAKTISH